jgi:hypothetical protein
MTGGRLLSIYLYNNNTLIDSWEYCPISIRGRFQQLFPDDLYMVWRIRTNTYLVALHAEHSG